MDDAFHGERETVILGSRLKAAAGLLLIAPPLLIPTSDSQVAWNWLTALLVGGVAFTRVLMPGRIVMDARGIRWRTLFQGGRMDWDEVAFAGAGMTFRWRSRPYLQRADSAPGRRRVWLPGVWPMSPRDLAERINAARGAGEPGLTERVARAMDEALQASRRAPSADAALRPAPAPVVAPPASPATAARPVFGRRGADRGA